MAISIDKLEDVQPLLKTLDSDPELMQANNAYMNGDHYQKMCAWGGPPVPGSIDGYNETTAALEKDQVPVPVIPEVIEAFATGVVGNEPAFSVELKRELAEDDETSPEEEKELGFFNDALTAFFDTAGANEHLHEFVENLCSGRATLRFFIPPEIAAKNDFKDLPDAAAKFYLESPEWDRAGVYTDTRSMKKVGIYLFKQEEDVLVNGQAIKQWGNRAEVTYLDDAGKTVFRVLRSGSTEPESEEVYDCNGHAWLFQAKLKRPIVGKAQQALQRKIDFENFILPKNAQYAGFRTEDFIGVQRPVDKDTGEYEEIERGPGVKSFWQPVYYEDSDGNKKPSAAMLVTSEPVDSSPIRDDIEHLVRILLKSCKQLHTVISGDASASAISRVQSRAQFVKALARIKPQVERVLRELFEVVICMACQLSGKTELLASFKANYRVRVDCKLDAGPITPEERTAIIAMYDAQLIDRETTQVMLGIEDIGSVNNALQRDEESNLDVLAKRVEIFNALAQTFDVMDAVELAGLPEWMIEKIRKKQKEVAGAASSGDDDRPDNRDDES